MKLQRREKILAAVCGAMLLVMVGVFLLVGGEDSLSTLRDKRDKLAKEVADKQARVEKATKARDRLTVWEHSSLPAGSKASSLYNGWLHKLADGAGLRNLDVQLSESPSPKGVFTQFTLTVHARATLAELTRFLYDFYSADNLDQLRGLVLTPVPSSPDLDVRMTIEARSLPGADRKDRLGAGPSDRLRLAKLADYTDLIVKRNLFAPYVAVGRRSRQIDPLERTFVTGIVEVDGRRQVWLIDRLAGTQWRLGEGERMEVAGVQGTVKSIASHDAVIEIDGRARRFHYGDNLRGGVELPRESDEQGEEAEGEE